MIEVEHLVKAPPERIWSVLADGWLYSSWVVGAVRMRDVDGHWPAVGARLHHSIGAWPVMIDDTTSVTEVEPGRRLVLQARGWPAGEATVIMTLRPEGDGTRVVMAEDASVGPGRFIPAPLRHAAIVPRNRESLRRLARLAEHDAAH